MDYFVIDQHLIKLQLEPEHHRHHGLMSAVCGKILHV